MAWYKTNNPATGGGKITDGGRILCEIAYAINEREHMMGRTETEWLGGLGSYPAVTDLNGHTVTSTRALIEQMRDTIQNKLIQYTVHNVTIWACDASWNRYGSFATLYNTAMGAGLRWATDPITGHRVNDGAILEEMMKCVEIINNWVVRPITGKRPFEDVAQQGDISDAGPYGSTQTILNAAVAGGVTVTPIVAPAGNYIGLLAHVHYTPDTYINFASRFGVYKLFVPYPSGDYAPDSVELVIPYDIGQQDGFTIAADYVPLNWYLRTISAAEYTTPPWVSAGTVRDTAVFDWLDPAGTFTYNDPDWLVANSINYFRFDMGTGNPFPLDPNQGKATPVWIASAGTPPYYIRLRYDFSGWKYN